MFSGALFLGHRRALWSAAPQMEHERFASRGVPSCPSWVNFWSMASRSCSKSMMASGEDLRLVQVSSYEFVALWWAGVSLSSFNFKIKKRFDYFPRFFGGRNKKDLRPRILEGFGDSFFRRPKFLVEALLDSLRKPLGRMQDVDLVVIVELEPSRPKVPFERLNLCSQ
jgi:hypothetical protein